jgi:glycosyltransferase involved in cell wall biosynthesis
LFQQNFGQLESINNISNINIDKNNGNNVSLNGNIEKQNQNIIQDIINNTNIQSNITKNISDNDTNRKLGIAFVYSTLFSNGISRFIIVTSNYFVETGRYDVYLITGKPYHKEYKFNEKIKRFIGYNNLTVIKNISRNYKIDFFILQNVLAISTIKWFKSLGSKIIGMFHGNYMSGMFLDDPFTYKHWKQFDLFDAYIFICSDDYYFYNSLNFTNHIFIPNLYTFEPSKIGSSNLTYNNIVMLGRQNDKIKGAIYAVKAMDLIVKEVPDAVLYIITSDSRIQFLKNLTADLNLTKNIKIVYHTYDISKYFFNSSIHMFTSLSEAFPMAMNEGKAHGLPIVAFDVPISNPYQTGVITVDSLDYVALAQESIKLLKDYNYRKRMGELSKLSLSKFSNEKTVELWEKLFQALREGKEKFRNLQKEVENKYYNKERAKKHIEKHFSDMKRYNSNFSCYTLENFTNSYYVSNIKACSQLNKTNNTISNSSVEKN